MKFNPLALLLDASLEGEFDLVQRIIYEVCYGHFCLVTVCGCLTTDFYCCSAQVDNPSTPNDEGITPLHNAVCAGHHHIVKFLLDFGVNVNAADSDGWWEKDGNLMLLQLCLHVCLIYVACLHRTPLHCAASCNSVHLCKLLVESGAAIFASTISDVETAADKCEEMEEGYIQCSQFLYGKNQSTT